MSNKVGIVWPYDNYTAKGRPGFAHDGPYYYLDVDIVRGLGFIGEADPFQAPDWLLEMVSSEDVIEITEAQAAELGLCE